MTSRASASRTTGSDATPARLRQRDEAVDVEQAAARAGGRRAALERQARERDAPAFADRADAVGVGDARVVEEDLGEVRVAVHLAQRPHVDAGRVQVDAERGDALVLRDGRIVAGEQQARSASTRPGSSTPSGRARATRRRRACARVDEARRGRIRRPARRTAGTRSPRRSRSAGASARTARACRARAASGRRARARRGTGRDRGRRSRRARARTIADLGRGRAEPAVLARPRRAPRARCRRAPRGSGGRLRGRRCRRRAPTPAGRPAGARAAPQLRPDPRAEVGIVGHRRRRRSSSRSGAFCTLPLAVRGRSARTSSRVGQLEARQTLRERGARASPRASARAPARRSRTRTPPRP